MSSQTQIFSINGVVDPNKTVWNNMELIAAAAASWISYDNTTGQYGVVINKPDNPVASFDDNNIIGSITLSETDYESLYNACEISFPNRDTVSRVDYIRYDEGVLSRYDYEPDNILSLSSDLINDSVQADVIAITELKQSRQNKVVSFASDFTALAINPGDVIRLTNEYWGWSNKLFRVTQMVEEDRDDGSIVVNITAIEYNDEVYAYNSITRFDRSESIGIPAVQANAPVQQTEDESTGQDVAAALATDVGKSAITGAGIPTFFSFSLGYSTSQVDTALNTSTAISVTYNAPNAQKYIQFALDIPQGEVDYDVFIDGVSTSRTYTGTVPILATLEYSSNNVTYNPVYTKIVSWASAPSLVFSVDSPNGGFWRVNIQKINSNVLDQDTNLAPTANDEVISIGNVATTANANGDAYEIKLIVFEN
jgi:hypothetical protein